MNEELKQDGTKRPHDAFTEATGYATVDAALKLADFSATLPNWKKQYQRNDFEEAMHTLAAEVRRLRAVLGEIADCPKYIERRFIIELASDAVKSHNDEAERRAQQKGNE